MTSKHRICQIQVQLFKEIYHQGSQIITMILKEEKQS